MQLYASLCSVNFKKYLMSISDQGYTEAIRSKLSNVLTFIAHLYTLNFVPDDDLVKLMRPAKHLSFEALHSLIAILTPKVKEAFLTGLEKIAPERMMEALKDMKIESKELEIGN